MPIYVVILYLFSSITLLLFGFLVLKNDSKSIVNRVLFSFSLSAVLWMLCLYLGFYWAQKEVIELSNTFFRLCFGFGFLMAFFLPIFFYYFTGNKVKMPKTLIRLFFFVGMFVFCISVFSPYVYESVVISENGELGDILGKFYLPFTYSFIFIFLTSLFISIRKLLFTQNGIEKKKLLIATWGSGIFMFLISMTNIILPIFGIFLFQLESGAFSLFFTIPAFYAIVRYRFLDITITFQRLLTEFSNVLVYAIPIVLFGDIFIQFPFLLLCVPIVVFSFRKYTHKAFNCFWNYFFFGKSTNYLEDLKNSVHDFKNSIKDGLLAITNILHTKDTRLAFSGEAGFENINNYFKEHSTEDLIFDEIDYLDRSQLNVSSSEIKKIKKEMDTAMVSAVIPVWGEGKKLIGLLLLERKINGALFSEQEIETTKKVIHDVAFYISHYKNYKKELTKDIKNNTLLSSVDSFNGLMHEMRHPLMIAQNVKELVDWRDVLPEDRKFIQESEEALSEMTHKLDAISEAFQWEKGLIDLQRSYIALDDFFEMIQKSFPDTKISFSIEKKIRKTIFSIDVHRLKEAFCEIIKNSCFFTNSVPDISILSYKKERFLCFDIQDNGKGILRKNWESVFDLLFVESFSRNRSECGLGVGLTKASGIVRKHGGSLEIIKSSEKEGTLLRVNIPFSHKELNEN